MAPAKTAFLFSHGAWYILEHYSGFLDAVSARGHKVVAPLLPSSHPQPWVEDVAQADFDVFREAAIRLVDEGYEVVAMGHSWGGMVVTAALHGLGLKERRANGLAGGVRWLLYLAAFTVDEGRSLEMNAPIDTIPFCDYIGNTKALLPEHDMGHIFFNDVPVEDRKKYVDMLVECPKQVSFKTLDHFAYKEIDSVFVYCIDDMAYPYAAQKRSIAALEQSGNSFGTEEIQASHSPFLSRKEELVGLVQKYFTI